MAVSLSFRFLPVAELPSPSIEPDSPPTVAVIMGSDSDLPSLHPAVVVLEQLMPEVHELHT